MIISDLRCWLRHLIGGRRHVSLSSPDKDDLLTYLKLSQFALDESTIRTGGGHSSLSDGTSFRHPERQQLVRHLRDLTAPTSFRQGLIGDWGWGTNSFFVTINDSYWHNDVDVRRRYRRQLRKSWRRLWRVMKRYSATRGLKLEGS